MDVSDAISSIDLTPGATHGALYDGMTADGSKVFFTTVDPLSGADRHDTSADIYQAEVSGLGRQPDPGLDRPRDGPGNTDSCDPVANSRVHTGTRPAPNRTAASSRSAAVAEWHPATALSTSSLPRSWHGSGHGVPECPQSLSPARHGRRRASSRPWSRSSPAPAAAAHPHLTATTSAPSPNATASKRRRSRSTAADTVYEVRSSAPGRKRGTGGLLTGPSAEGTGTSKRAPAKSNRRRSKSGPSASARNTAPVRRSHDQALLGAGVIEISQPAEATATAVHLTAKQSFSESFFGIVSPPSLAVDQSNGDLYVPDIVNNVVDRFGSSGEYLSQIPVGWPFRSRCRPRQPRHLCRRRLWERSSLRTFRQSGQSFSTGHLPSGIAVDSERHRLCDPPASRG